MPDEDPFAPICGCSLVQYAAICRELVRGHGRSDVAAARALEAHDLTPREWAEIQHGWSARIGSNDAVRAAFRELYARN